MKITIKKKQGSLNMMESGCSLVQLVEAQVERSPKDIAVSDSNQALTYEQLNCQANQCAHLLRLMGIGEGDIVGIILERSVELSIALLAILKAGAGYLPLDPAMPTKRLSFVIQDANLSVLVSEEKFDWLLMDFDLSIIKLDSEREYIQSLPTDNTQPPISEKSLAYVIYTSGSTGQPKGCLIQHKAIVNRLLWMQNQYKLTNQDKILQKTPYTFDVSVWELFWPLLTGAQLIYAKPEGHKDHRYLIKLIHSQQITVCHFVPSMLRMFLNGHSVKNCSSLRYLFASGEVLPYDLMEQCLDTLPAKLINLYGPTEAAIDVSYWFCETRDDKLVPIGKPIDNIRLYIVDSQLKPVGKYQEGELCIAGIGLAQGYLNRAELTAEKFVENPVTIDEARIYRTGDRVSMLNDGEISYIGRLDNQVKLRGQRIELGDIESQLLTHPEITNAIVTVQEVDSSDPKLVAYIQLQGQTQATVADLSFQKLKQFLLELLPESMIPNYFHIMDSFPMSQHGKLDPKKLPWPLIASNHASTVESNRDKPKSMLTTKDDHTETVAQIIQGVLGNDSLLDNSIDLYELGATSLTLVQIAENLHTQFKLELPVEILLDKPSVMVIARFINNHTKSSAALSKIGIPTKTSNLTSAQATNLDKASSITAELIDYLQGLLSVSELPINNDLFDSGATSMTLLQLTEWVQEKYQLSLPVELILESPTVALIAAYIEQNTHKYSAAEPQAKQDSSIIALIKQSFNQDIYKFNQGQHRFSNTVIKLDEFSQFLGMLSVQSVNNQNKYLYASGGGLNPVQTYVWIKEQGVENIPAGLYYYHPENHQLVRVTQANQLTTSAFNKNDHSLLLSCQFAVFFIAEFTAVAPLYQEASIALTAVEVGYMQQLLLNKQCLFSIGLAPVHGVDITQLNQVLPLSESQRFLQCILGGSRVVEDKNEIKPTGPPTHIKENLSLAMRNLRARFWEPSLVFQGVQVAKLKDKASVEKFHHSKPHLRKFAPDTFHIDLSDFFISDVHYQSRGSCREYTDMSLSMEQISALLGMLQAEQVEKNQLSLHYNITGDGTMLAYLYIKEGTVDGVPAGLYCYQSETHQLKQVVAYSSELNNAIEQSYTPYNRKHAKNAAIILYLVANKTDLEERFGEEGLHLAMLEAGAIGQMLMERQSEFDIGLCPIGGIREDKIRPLFPLDNEDVLLHSFVVGAFSQQVPEDRVWLNSTTKVTVVNQPSVVHSEPNFPSKPKSVKVKEVVKSSESIAIIGMSIRMPNAATLAEFWDLLIGGELPFSELPNARKALWQWRGDPINGAFLDDIECFDSLLFNISPREARSMDPQERTMLEVAWECLEDAGYPSDKLNESLGQVGVYIGSMWEDYKNVGQEYWQIQGHAGEASNSSSIANRLSYYFNCNGPSLTVNTSCSSALTAIHLACDGLIAEQCRAALVGGINVLSHPYHYSVLKDINLLSESNKPSPFGAEANGWVLGEGAGVFLLKTLSHAQQDNDLIYAVIKATSIAHSGRTSRYSAPNSQAQTATLRELLNKAELTCNAINYIEAAAPGASLADATEFSALNSIFDHHCNIGTVKGYIGHLESASAISQVAKVIAQMQHKTLLPCLNIDATNVLVADHEQSVQLVRQSKAWLPVEEEAPLRAIINAFGATGSGGHILLESYTANRQLTKDNQPLVICLSANETESLNQMMDKLCHWLETAEAPSLMDIAYTLSVGRTELSYRTAFIVKDLNELKSSLQNNLSEADGQRRFYGHCKDELTDNDFSFSNAVLVKFCEEWIKNSVSLQPLSKYLAEKGGHRISLPTYAFVKERHWLKQLNSLEVTLPSPQQDSKTSDQLSTLLRDMLIDKFSAVSEIARDKINPATSLEKYGLNSIIISYLNGELENIIGSHVAKTLFFEYPDLNTVVQVLVKEYSAELMAWFDVEGDPPLHASSIQQNSHQRAVYIDPSDSKSKHCPIAIVGVAGRYPDAKNIEQFWQNLLQGKDSITTIPANRWELDEIYPGGIAPLGSGHNCFGGFLEGIEGFDPLFFGIAPRQAEVMDPQIRLFMQTVWEVVEDAGYSSQALNDSCLGQVGVFVGVMYGEYQLYTGYDDEGTLTQGQLSYGSIAHQISYVMDFHGPSLAIDTMCSSSLTAIHLAVQSIKRGECKAAVAGGVNVSIHPNKFITQTLLGMNSKDGRCRSFGLGGDGFVPSEGVGAILLKSLDSAIEDSDHIYGLVRGSSINSGGKTNGYTVPSPAAQAELFTKALIDADCYAEQISYIEAHGTGTALGDPIEIAGLQRAFATNTRDKNNLMALGQYCAIGSVKSNIGHCESAAGIAGVTKVLLQLKHKMLTASLHSQQLNSNIDFVNTPFKVQQELTSWPEHSVGGVKEPRTAGVLSFGAGGANAAVIIGEYINRQQAQQQSKNSQQDFLFILSAKSSWQLVKQAENLKGFLRTQTVTENDLASMAYTLQVGRGALQERVGFIASTIDELSRKLDWVINGTHKEHIRFGRCHTDTIEPLSNTLTLKIENWLKESDLQPLLEKWVTGTSIDWQMQYSDVKPMRLSLPTYPFDNKNYWIPKKTCLDPKLSKEGGENNIGKSKEFIVPKPEQAEIGYFQECWIAEALNSSLPIEQQTIVCFVADPKDKLRLQTSLEESSDLIRLVFVTPYESVIQHSPLNYGAKLQDSVSCLQLLNQISTEISQSFNIMLLLNDSLQQQVSNYQSIMALVQGISQSNINCTRLLLVGEPDSVQKQSFIDSCIGFESSLAKILPKTKLAVLNLLENTLLAPIWRELNSQSFVSTQYRENVRYVRQVTSLLPVQTKSTLKTQGTYVITGGSGGIGRAVAEYLAEKYQAELILVGRTVPNQTISELITQLELLGGSVCYQQADVCDANQIHKLVNDLNNKGQSIDGVIHAAGIQNHQSLLASQWSDFEKAIAAKVTGTLNLMDAFKDVSLDFFCCFSSSSAILGDFGACSYAVANRFQKAIAENTEQVISINWPLWANGGMSSGEQSDAHDYLKFTGQQALDNVLGCETFDNLIGYHHKSPLVLFAQPAKFVQLTQLTKGAPKSAKPLPKISLRGLSTEQCLRAELQAIAGTLLKIPADQIRMQENLAEYGFDSITLTAFAERLSNHFGLNITPALFFSHSNLASLSEHLINNHKESLDELYQQPDKGNFTQKQLAAHRSIARAKESVKVVQVNSLDEKVAIIGMSGRFPQARDINEFWDILVNGENAVTEIPSERFAWRDYYGDPQTQPGTINCKWTGTLPGVKEFDAGFFHVSPAEAETMDPRQRLLLQESWNALEYAGIVSDRFEKIGVFVGVEQGDYGLIAGENTSVTANHDAILASRLSYTLNLQGPVMALNTACSSSLVAAHQACLSLRAGECNSALAAGVNLILTPQMYFGMAQAGMLSETGQCRAFDKAANGIVPGEAVAVVVLKLLSNAIRDNDSILAVIEGSGINYDGKTNGITAPNGAAQARLYKQVYEQHNIDAKDINYVVAHGTGTPLGDPVEINALNEVFKQYGCENNSCAVTSTKSNFGHTFAASGLVSLISMVQSLNHQMIPASLHVTEQNDYIQWESSPLFVNTINKAWPRVVGQQRLGAISSFGMSGTNAHMVVASFDEQQVVDATTEYQDFMLALSARTAAALAQKVTDLLEQLRDESFDDDCLQRLSYTLLLRRAHFNHRCVVVVQDRESAIYALQAQLNNQKLANVFTGKVPHEFQQQPMIAESAKVLLAKTQDAEIDVQSYRELLCALSDFYCQGYQLSWQGLFGDDRLTSLVLPPYPFAKKQYWPANAAALTHNLATINKLHPLLHENISDIKGLKYRVTLTGKERFLTEHRIDGNPVLPGVAHIEMARCAMSQVLNLAEDKQDSIVITNVVWLRPVSITGDPIELTILIEPESSNSINYRIVSLDKNNNEVVYSHGHCQLAGKSEQPSIDIKGLVKLCTDNTINHQQCYQALSHGAVEFGPSYRCINQLNIGQDTTRGTQVLAALKQPMQSDGKPENFVLAPGLIDSALQGSMAFNGSLDGVSLPFALGSLQVFSQCPEICYAWIRESEDPRKDADLRKLDVDIADDEGKVCVRIKGFVSRIVRLAPLEASSNESIEPSFVPKPRVTVEQEVLLMPTWQPTIVKQPPLFEQWVAENTLAIYARTSTYFGEIFEQNPDLNGLILDVQDSIEDIAERIELFTDIDNIMFLSGNSSDSIDVGDRLIEAATDNTLLCFKTIKALLQLGYGSKKINWVVVTENSVSFNDNQHQIIENTIDSSQACLHGLFGAMAKEYTNWHVRLYDIPVTSFDFGAQPFPSSEQDIEWAWRRGQWFQQKLQTIEPEDCQEAAYTQQGVYIVIGGAGGIGEVWTEMVIRQYQAKVIWIGRRKLNNEIETKIQRLGGLGPAPEYYQADASDKETLDDVYQQIKNRHSSINGVVHCAINLQDQSLANLTERRFKLSLIAKVDTSVRMAQVFANEPLDFILFFSSIQSFTRSAGQSNYAAGCAFTDAFAHQLGQTWPTKVKVINWGYWGSVGVAATEEFRIKMAKSGVGSIEPAQAMDALNYLLNSEHRQLVYIKVLDTTKRKGESFEIKISPNMQVDPIESIPLLAPEPTSDKLTGTMSDSETKSRITNIIFAKLSESMKLPSEEIDGDENFMDYGVDSITGMQLVQAINRELRVDLDPTSLFSYPTIFKLVEYIFAEHAMEIQYTETSEQETPSQPPGQLVTERLEQQSVIEFVSPFTPQTTNPEEVNGTEAQPLNNIEKSLITIEKQVSQNKKQSDDIAVIGISGRFSQSESPEELWQHLANGDDLIQIADRWDLTSFDAGFADPQKGYCRSGSFLKYVDKFDPLFFNISVLEATYMDPQQRIFLEESWKALEDAGYAGTSVEGAQCGVYVGCAAGEYSGLFQETPPAQAFWGNAPSVLASRIAYYLDLHGPAIAIDTACSSSLVAIHMACQSLKSRETDLALAGGIWLQVTPNFFLTAGRAGMLSAEGRCHTFDSRADGFVPGEGAGVVVLKRASEAVSDGDQIYGVIKGSGINQDGASNGIIAPNAKSQENLVRRVYQTAGINPESIQLVEAHGTGTGLGDPIEFKALTNAFRKDTDKKGYCAIGSIKTNIGHAATAAGVASVIKVLMAIKHQKLPASLHFENGNPAINFEDSPFYVNTSLKNWHVVNEAPRRAAISSFGFSGTNSHMVIEESLVSKLAHRSQKQGYLLVLSAHSEQQLKQQAAQLLVHLESGSNISLGDTCYTLMVGRKSFEYRLATVVSRPDDLKTQLRHWIELGSAAHTVVGKVDARRVREQFELNHLGEQYLLDCCESEKKDCYLDNLNKLAELYVKGHPLDYSALFADDSYYRISLPTYPFAKEAYWVDEPTIKTRDVEELAVTNIARSEVELYQPLWKDIVNPNKRSEINEAQFVLLLGDFTQDHVRLIESSSDNFRCEQVVSDQQSTAERYQEYCLNAFNAIKNMFQDKPSSKVVLQVMLASDSPEIECYLGLAGLLKSAMQENPLLLAQVIVFNDEVTSENLLSAVHTPVEKSATEVRINKGKRQFKTYQKLNSYNGVVNNISTWSDDGCYLITGGLGNLGMLFAHDIAKNTKNVKLILTGRSNPADINELKLAELRELGADVRYKMLDVSDRNAVITLVNAIQLTGDSLTGVLHCAGVIQDNYFLNKTSQEVIDVLQPKVMGIENLDRATQNLPLDFMVAFSSLSSVYGNAGQSDYAAANGFMDGFIRHRNHLVNMNLRKGRSLSINWPLWAEGGMGSEIVKSSGQGLDSISGIEAFKQILATDHELAQIAVICSQPESLQSQTINTSEGNAPLNAKIFPMIEANALHAKTLQLLKRLFSKVTKLNTERIDTEKALESYGIDSLMITDLNRLLEQALGQVPKTLFYQYETLTALTQFLVDSYPEECNQWVGMEMDKLVPSVTSTKALTKSIKVAADVKTTAKLPQLTAEIAVQPIAILGLSGRYPQADNVNDFWENIKAGVDSITDIPEQRWATDGFYCADVSQAIMQGKSYSKWGGFIEGFADFDPLFFGLAPKEAENIDPQERLFLQASWDAIEDSSILFSQFSPQMRKRVGVFGGITKQGFNLYCLESKGHFPNTSFSSLTNRVSYYFNLQGPSVTVDTMCSSALVSIHNACEYIRSGKGDMALAGGVNLYLHPVTYIGASMGQMLSSSRNCLSFGQGGDGFVPGEGVGVVVLKALDQAIADNDGIYAVIQGTAINHNGKTSSYTTPNPNQQADVIQQALDACKMDKRTISYIEASANGSEMGDAIEMAALQQVFGGRDGVEGDFALGSVKPNIGHCESASGMSQLTKVIFSLVHKQLAPTRVQDNLNPAIDFENLPFKLQTELSDWSRVVVDGKEVPRRAGITGIGAGGVNAHIIVEEV